MVRIFKEITYKMYVWIFMGELFSSVAVILGKWSEIGTGVLRGLVLNDLCPAFGI